MDVGEGRCLCETEHMLMIISFSNFNCFWIPKVVICKKSEVKQLGDIGKVLVEEWWLHDHDYVY